MVLDMTPGWSPSKHGRGEATHHGHEVCSARSGGGAAAGRRPNAAAPHAARDPKVPLSGCYARRTACFAGACRAWERKLLPLPLPPAHGSCVQRGKTKESAPRQGCSRAARFPTGASCRTPPTCIVLPKGFGDADAFGGATIALHPTDERWHAGSAGFLQCSQVSAGAAAAAAAHLCLNCKCGGWVWRSPSSSAKQAELRICHRTALNASLSQDPIHERISSSYQIIVPQQIFIVRDSR